MTAVSSDLVPKTGVRQIRIGISACLLGHEVRLDGGHKRDAFLTETFGRFVEWVPVCPEVECGLGTPRESMRLVRDDNGVRLLTVKGGADMTAAMERFSQSRASALAREDLSGFVLKKDSPSCGLELFCARWTIGDLVRFHASHKLLLLAHAPEAYRQLGRLVAGAAELPRRDVEQRYVEQFMLALRQLATPRRHANVLQQMAGYFKDRLDGASRRELADTIADFWGGLVPLIVPLTLLRHYVRVFEVAYSAGQAYVQPHPKELMLRNHM